MAEAPGTDANGAGPPVERIRPLSLGGVTAGLNSIGTALIFGLLVLINSDIVGRALFDSPVRGVPEIVALSFVAIVFLQLPHSLRLGQLTVADSVFSHIARARPRAAKAALAVYNLTGAALLGVIFFACWPFFVDAWTQDLFIGSEGNFTAPIWPVRLVIQIGCAVMAIQFLALAWREGRAALGRERGAP